MALDTPILFLVFNRPEPTLRVFEQIRAIQPKRLYIAADGFRENKDGEEAKCLEVRKIVTNVDWDCDVKTLFRDENLGCGLAVSSAISWFFDNEEDGIILEDDCLPDLSFFKFCESLLDKYRNDSRVMHIGGVNFCEEQNIPDESYYFSMIMHCWGWASWRRAWNKYNYKLTINDDIRKSLQNYTNERRQINYWEYVHNSMSGEVPKWNTWDYQWGMAIIKNNGLTIVPKYNLIQNIGYGPDGTHTIEENWQANMAVRPLNTLTHPEMVERSKIWDNNTFNKMLPAPSAEKKKSIRYYFNRTKSILSRLVKN